MEHYDQSIWEYDYGKPVKIYTESTKSDLNAIYGTYISKHVDIGIHYLLVNGEKEKRPFHIFNFEFIRQ